MVQFKMNTVMNTEIDSLINTKTISVMHTVMNPVKKNNNIVYIEQNKSLFNSL